ncbi:MAG: hypothetical protein JNJ59_27680 [Deltaproteobacteria bacterium]|nr:hypothetical protein [Deltaproteobacteria bacterium]
MSARPAETASHGVPKGMLATDVLASPASQAEAAPQRAPFHVKDELAWELVRDEWELLLAIGSGPTSVETAADQLATEAKKLEKRVKVLVEHGLVAAHVGGGFQLVPAFYERREGMSSYLRDLVLRRLQDGGAAPVAGRAKLRIGDGQAIAAHIERAEVSLFSSVVALANRPESTRSQRFSVFFAAAESPEAAAVAVQPYDGRGFREQLLRILRSAATARSLAPETRKAYLWVAEMRTDPEVALEIGELFEDFLDSLPTTDEPSPGALAFAVLPATARQAVELASPASRKGGN